MNRYLLTGAGFTHNWGAPLAQEMWNYIFNDPEASKNPQIKEILLGEFNYEKAYSDILKNTNLHNKISNIMGRAYKILDNIICDIPYGPDFSDMQQFLERFIYDKNKKSYIFTLNQDLFLERKFFSGGTTPYNLPANIFGLKVKKDFFKDQTITDNDSNKLALEPHPSSINYIKLHGSQNWYSDESKKIMVIGTDKIKSINSFNIIKKLNEFFKEKIQSGGKILIIGYGFGDPHINETLSLGIEKGLELFLLSPSPPQEIKEKLTSSKYKCQCGPKIWKSISNFYEGKIKDIFPLKASSYGKQILANFFNESVN